MHWELWWRHSCRKGKKKANCGLRQKGCCFHLSHCQSLFLCSREVVRIRAKGMFYSKNERWNEKSSHWLWYLDWCQRWLTEFMDLYCTGSITYRVLCIYSHIYFTILLLTWIVSFFLTVTIGFSLSSSYIHHLVWVGRAEQTTGAVPDGRQFVFLLRVSSDELANTVAFELKMPLHATLKIFLQKWDAEIWYWNTTFSFIRNR